MRIREKIFLKDSEICFNSEHRARLTYNLSKYDDSVSRGKKRYDGFNQARQYASDIKDNVILNLPEYLEEFENKITSRGTHVLWARNSLDAISYVGQILRENNTKLLVKTKSMVSEEIEFNKNAESWGIESVETDLGEFIVQTAGEKPYHIVTPAMHKSKEDIARLFNEKFGMQKNASPGEITAFVRKRLRNQFINAEAGVSGANFIVADVGGIGLTENEGNGLMTVSFPKIHIVIAGIERVIPSVSQLPFFFQWLGVHGTGQNISAYNSLLLGPKSNKETDGPEKMYVILLDNRRSSLFAENEESQALKCIRCGACLNSCPVYKNVGGYTYSTTYSGPIGSVITPFYNGFRDYGHLSFACSVCGRCSEVCPVKIPLHELLLLNRRRKVEHYESAFVWNKGMKAYQFTFRNRKRIDFVNGVFKNKLILITPNLMGQMKKMPHFTPESFNQKWKSINQ
jgi:L-lactate dehydrogenase complex protein LldF